MVLADYTSRFSELGFYVDGHLRKFHGGRYSTTNKKEIAVLDTLADVQRIDAEEKESQADKAESSAEANKRKASAK